MRRALGSKAALGLAVYLVTLWPLGGAGGLGGPPDPARGVALARHRQTGHEPAMADAGETGVPAPAIRPDPPLVPGGPDGVRALAPGRDDRASRGADPGPDLSRGPPRPRLAS